MQDQGKLGALYRFEEVFVKEREMICGEYWIITGEPEANCQECPIAESCDYSECKECGK